MSTGDENQYGDLAKRGNEGKYPNFTPPTHITNHFIDKEKSIMEGMCNRHQLFVYGYEMPPTQEDFYPSQSTCFDFSRMGIILKKHVL